MMVLMFVWCQQKPVAKAHSHRLKPTRLKVWGAEWTVRLCRFFTTYASTHSTSFQVKWIPGYSVFALHFGHRTSILCSDRSHNSRQRPLWWLSKFSCSSISSIAAAPGAQMFCWSMVPLVWLQCASTSHESQALDTGTLTLMGFGFFFFRWWSAMETMTLCQVLKGASITWDLWATKADLLAEWKK